MFNCDMQARLSERAPYAKGPPPYMTSETKEKCVLAGLSDRSEMMPQENPVTIPPVNLHFSASGI